MNALLFCAVLLAVPADPPPADAIARAHETLRDIYGDRLDSTGRGGAAALARELIVVGRRTADDPAGRWVCWNEARRLAIAAGDKPLAFETVRLLAGEFRYPKPAGPAECIRRARAAWERNEWTWRLAAWAWYTQAAGGGALSGLNKVEAEKRIGAIEREAGVTKAPLTVQVLAEKAILHGSKIVMKDGVVKMWTDTGEWVSFSVVLEPGTYEVEIEYACADDSYGSVVAVEIEPARWMGRISCNSTTTWENYQWVSAGSFSWRTAGEATISLRALEKPRIAVMDLRSVRFVRQ